MSHRLNFINSSKAFYSLLFIVLLLAMFALRGQSMLSGNSYGDLDVEKSPLFEYSLVFFALAVCFYDQSKIKMSLILFLVSFILIKDLLYGGRITSIMLLLFTYSMYFEDKIAKKYVFILFGLSIFALISFQFIRTHPFLFLSGNISFSDIFNSVVEPNTNETLASNQGDIAQSSARLYGFVDKGILPFEDRISSFYYFLVSIFTPGISFSELGSLAQYKKDEYSAGGGGLLPVFFYVWLSYPGVVLSGYLVSRFNKLYVNAKKNYMIIFSGLLLATFPRWFVYSPIIIFKLCAYVIPFYLIFVNVFFKKSQELD
ncbi:hypothetical protein [Flavobacterium sp. ALD4]|uniref:hypothetical protein n=1 Tax=Flavobacterium sp. ALD4 TaxID=2058314 RepID=UPI0012FEEABA|nr:hypothetical protein [Flavobacterium sp. ALD4]